MKIWNVWKRNFAKRADVFLHVKKAKCAQRDFTFERTDSDAEGAGSMNTLLQCLFS